MNMAPALEIEPDRFRRALSLFPSGLVVIAATGAAGQKVGFTCQSFYSVSLDPPLVSFSVMRTSTTYPIIRDAGAFSVSVLAEQHHDVSYRMGRRGEDKWNGVDLVQTLRGNPVLADSVTWLDCELHAEHEAGDHFIVVGTVVEIAPEPVERVEPILFYQGGFRRLDQDGPARLDDAGRS